MRRHNGGPMALWIGRAGQMTGKLPYSRMKNYGGDGYTVGPSWSLQIHESRFPEMLAAIPSMTQRCRLDHDGSRPRGHAHGAAGGKARRLG